MGIIIYLVLQIVKTELYCLDFIFTAKTQSASIGITLASKLDLKKEIQVLSTKFGIFYQKEMRELKKRASDEALFFTMFHYFIVFHSKIAPHQDQNSSLRHHSR